MSFRNVLLVCVLAPFLLFCIVFFAYKWRADVHMAERVYEHILMQNAQRQQARVEEYFALIEEMCATVTSYLGRDISRRQLAELNEADFTAFLNRIVTRRPEIAAAGFALLEKWNPEQPGPIFFYKLKTIDPGGGTRLETLDLRAEPFASADWFTAVRDSRKPRWDEPFEYDKTGDWIFTYTVPVMVEDEFFGMLCVDTRVEDYTRIINRSAAELGDGVFCVLVNGAGEYVLSPHLQDVKDKARLFDAIAPEDGGGRERLRELHASRRLGVARVTLREKSEGRHFVVTAPLGTEDNLTLAVFLPERNLFAPLYRQLAVGISFMLAGVVLAAGIAVLLLALVTNPLRQAVAAAQRIGEGSLEEIFSKPRFREFAVLGDAFNRMVEAIRSRSRDLEKSVDELDKILRQVAISSRELAQVASHVSGHSQDLSSGAVEQDSVFQEISSSIQRLKEHADSNAALAKETNDIISRVEDTAVSGNFEMRRLSEAMQQISGISQSINNALKMIDNIAFQTNILALNAAVEAARAGTHGRGFNVVASEVRQLANRSAQSVVHTSQTLQESDEKVEMGLELGRKTSESLSAIEDIATNAAKLMNRVTEQAMDQSRIIGEVLIGLGQVTEIAKKNVNNASANAAVSEELLTLATSMSNMLSSPSGSGDGDDAPARRLPAPGRRDA